jgi:TPR repeat protein
LSLAQVKLAELYERGLGVDKDVAKARILLERAARNGYAPAQARLKEMGVEGPVPPAASVAAVDNDAAAAPIRRPAVSMSPIGEPTRRAAPGDPLTPDMIAAMSAEDGAIMQAGLTSYRAGDKPGAFRAWRHVAEKGVGEAQARIGLLFVRGEGVTQDMIEGYRWLRLAAAQGNGTAWAELPLVAAQLSPAERAIGESLVRSPTGAQNKPP